MGFLIQDGVCTAETSKLGDPQAGLDRKHEHGVVAPANPGGTVAGGQEGVDLVVDEVCDEIGLEALRRDGQYPLNACRVLGVVQRGVGEEGMDGGEAVVAGADGVVAVSFEVVQESANKRGDQVCDVQG